MHDFLKEQYQFSDYQIALLEFFGKTVSSEISKLLIMGFIFRDVLGLYLFAVTVMSLLRISTGGFHCNTYFSCLFFSIGYMFTSMMLLPLIPVNKLLQMILLFACILINYYIGPITSEKHCPITAQTVKRVRIQSFIIIFFYLTLTYIVPESPYITVGFWVIIMHTLQLFVARVITFAKGGRTYREKQTY